MAGGGQAELRGSDHAGSVCFAAGTRQIIILQAPGSSWTRKMKAKPGIVGYLVQPGDSLWDVVRFHTTEKSIPWRPMN